MNPIESKFNERFASWGIVLPYDEVMARRCGKIIKSGWIIWFLFGEDSSGEYLDYYSSHRMAGDNHIRIHADGSEKALPSICPARSASLDPVKDAEYEKAFFRENQEVSEMLRTKGFGLEGDEFMGSQINRLLSTGELK